MIINMLKRFSPPAVLVLYVWLPIGLTVALSTGLYASSPLGKGDTVPSVPKEQKAGESLINRIMLIDKPGRNGSHPIPTTIRIGIQLNRCAYYTLSKEHDGHRTVISSGLFNSGQNIVPMTMEKYYKEPGFKKFTYTLKLKSAPTGISNPALPFTISKSDISKPDRGTGTVTDTVSETVPKTVTKTLIIGIEVEARKKPEKQSDIYELSMFIGNYPVYAIAKKVNRLEQLKAITKKTPYLVEHHPAYPPGENPAKYRATVNPLALAFLAGKVIAKKIKKDRLKRMHHVQTRRMHGTYDPNTVDVMLWTK